MSDPAIPGGYYIKARTIQESKIMSKPPYMRDIWDYLLREANHKDRKSNGRMIKRGQLVRSFRAIQNDLCWYCGFRKETYKKWQCEKTMAWLREQGMITTTKTTRGLVVTIEQYGFYQNPKNYENNKGSNMKETGKQQSTDTINKNVKNGENDKNEKDIDRRIVKEIFNHWVGLKHTISHRNITGFKKHIEARLEDYSVTELKEAMNNYNEAIERDDCYWTHSSWGLDDFLKQKSGKQVDRFLEGIEQFKKDKGKSKSNQGNSSSHYKTL